MNHQGRYLWYDAIRGFCAVLVCASHLRAMMLVDLGEVEQKDIIIKCFYFLTGLGHQSVMVFFVLSGFFVGGSIIKNRDTFKVGSYLQARLVRLFVVLIPALAFTLLADKLLQTLNPEVLQGTYASKWNSGPSSAIPWSITLSTAIGNILFVQGIATPVFGTNGPLWSLAYEFWYYVTFPVLGITIGFIRGFGSISRALMGCLIFVSIFLTPLPLALGFGIWTLGVLAYLVGEKQGLMKLALTVGGIIVFGASIIITKIGLLSEAAGDLLIGGSFALLACGLAGKGGSFIKKIGRWAIWMSEISYSLYLFHFPLLALVGGVMLHGKQLQPTFANIILFIVSLFGLIFAGYMSWLAFEQHTPSIRAKIKDFCFRGYH